jgi:TPR repeat protein
MSNSQINASVVAEAERSTESLSAHGSGEAATPMDLIRTDLQKTAHYFKLAADQGLADAQFNYGVCLENGRGVPSDFQKAVHYYKLAADQEMANAQLNYGICLYNGRGVPIDLQKGGHFLDGRD